MPLKGVSSKIHWLQQPKYALAINHSLSHNQGFVCDSVIGIDYFGFEGEHSFYPINDKGEEISSIKHRQKLTAKQFATLNAILGNPETYQHPQIIGCYEPRLAFVYFKDHKVIGQTQVCLSCAQVQSTAETIKGAYGEAINEKAIDQLDALRIELGFSNNPR